MKQVLAVIRPVEVDVAVTKQKNLTLNAFSAAALLLPGLVVPSAHAADNDEMDFCKCNKFRPQDLCEQEKK